MQSNLSACREANIVVYEGAKDNLPDADRKICPEDFLLLDVEDSTSVADLQ